jgi:hypothetical protein
LVGREVVASLRSALRRSGRLNEEEFPEAGLEEAVLSEGVAAIWAGVMAICLDVTAFGFGGLWRERSAP